MKRGFTLVELLVVIAILAVLAALLFPVFARAKAAARSTEGLANLRQMGAAFALYSNDSDEVLPQSTEGILGEGQEGGWIFNARYGNEGAGDFLPARGTVFPYVRSEGGYRSANDPTHATARNSFAFNGCLIAPPFVLGINRSRSASESPDPVAQMLLTEELCVSREGAPQGTNDGFFHPYFDRFAEWHAGGAAIAFLDGHAKIQRTRGRAQTLLHGGETECWPPEPDL